MIDLGGVHVAGLAEAAGDMRAHAMRGSLQYTAPEYFAGDGGSESSDLFALALIAWQMLSGQLPYGLQLTRALTLLFALSSLLLRGLRAFGR